MNEFLGDFKFRDLEFVLFFLKKSLQRIFGSFSNIQNYWLTALICSLQFSEWRHFETNDSRLLGSLFTPLGRVLSVWCTSHIELDVWGCARLLPTKTRWNKIISSENTQGWHSRYPCGKKGARGGFSRERLCRPAVGSGCESAQRLRCAWPSNQDRNSWERSSLDHREACLSVPIHFCVTVIEFSSTNIPHGWHLRYLGVSTVTWVSPTQLHAMAPWSFLTGGCDPSTHCQVSPAFSWCISVNLCDLMILSFCMPAKPGKHWRSSQVLLPAPGTYGMPEVECILGSYIW